MLATGSSSKNMQKELLYDLDIPLLSSVADTPYPATQILIYTYLLLHYTEVQENETILDIPQ